MTIISSIRKIARTDPELNRRLNNPPEKSQIVSKTGQADYPVPDNGSASSGGGGIASPLTEGGTTGSPNRAYYAEQEVRTTDGLFVLMIAPIQTMNFTDDNGDPVQIQYTQKNF